MAVQIAGSTTTNKLSIDGNGIARATPYPPNVSPDGAFRLCLYTGVLTGVAAGSATAGHLFAARWSQTTPAVITRLRARWFTIAGFTAAQEAGLEIFRTTSHSVAHSGGTSATPSTNTYKKRIGASNPYSTSRFADIRISTTGALTAGTHTLDSAPITAAFFAELAAGAAVPKGFFECGFQIADLSEHPLILGQNEGIIVRNGRTAMGAGGTATVVVEMDWFEMASF